MNNTGEKTKNRGWILRFFLVLLVLTVSVSAALLAIGNNGFSFGKSDFKQISFDVNAGNLYAWIEDGLVVASGTGIQLIGAGGETLAADTVILQNPAVARSAALAAVWSTGGKDFYTVGKEKGIVRTSLDRKIINLYVNRENWVAVSAQEEGYRGSVSVYNSKLKPVYKWSSGDAYLVDAAISDSSDKMAAYTISESGSRVQFFQLNSTEQKGSYTCENTVLLDLAYLSNSSVCALSMNSAFFLNDKGSLISRYDFTDGYLKDFSLEGSGFAALLIGKYKAGSSGTIVTLSPAGAELGKLDVKSEILSFSVSGKYVAVLYSDSLVIYRSDMTVYAKAADISSIRQVLMRPDGSVVMLSNSGAAIYKP